MSSKVAKVVRVEVILEGYLDKKSPKRLLGVAAYQLRYFVLTLSTTDRGTTFKVLSYFRTQEDEEPLGNIPLSDIKAVNHSKEKNCRFDIVIANRTYELRAENSADLAKWTQGLNSILEAKKGGYVKPQNLPSSPAETMKLMAEATPDSAKLFESQATLEMMREGCAFMKYDFNKTENVVTRTVVLVFLNQQDGTPIGSLYWSYPGDKSSDPSKRLCLHELSDLYLGKQNKAFKSSLAANSAADRCFTASASSGIDLNLEGDTRDQVAAWLFGINLIMISRGNRRVVTADKAKAKAPVSPTAAAASQPAPSSPTNAASTSADGDVGTRKASGSVFSGPTFHAEDDDEEEEEPTNTDGGKGEEGKPSAEPVPPPAPPAAPAPPADSSSSSSPSSSSSSDNEVAVWLRGLGPAFEQYTDGFVENGVDINFLLTLDADDLEELGVASKLHRKKLTIAIDDLRVSKGLRKSDEIATSDKSLSPTAAPVSPRSGAPPPPLSLDIPAAPSPSAASSASVPAAPPAAPVVAAPAAPPMAPPVSSPSSPTAPALAPSISPSTSSSAPGHSKNRGSTEMEKSSGGGSFLAGLLGKKLKPASERHDDKKPPLPRKDSDSTVNMSDILAGIKAAKLRSSAPPRATSSGSSAADVPQDNSIASIAAKMAEARKQRQLSGSAAGGLGAPQTAPALAEVSGSLASASVGGGGPPAWPIPDWVVELHKKKKEQANKKQSMDAGSGETKTAEAEQSSAAEENPAKPAAEEIAAGAAASEEKPVIE